MLYLVVIRPFVEKTTEVSLVIGEICLFMFYFIFALPYISNIRLSSTKTSSICIFIVIANITVNVSISLFIFIRKVRDLIRARKLNKVTPIKNTEVEQAKEFDIKKVQVFEL